MICPCLLYVSAKLRLESERMANTDYFNSGSAVVHRGVYKDKVWIARAVRVIEDNSASTKLLLTPGTLCKFSAGLVARRYSSESNNTPQSRWDEQETLDWRLVNRIWQERRFLILLQPSKYYSIQLCWQHNTEEFLGWYVNFELPFTRNYVGFDTLDLELDLIVKPNLSFYWKDAAEYQEGIRRGIITPDQVSKIEEAETEVLDLIEKKVAPFDGSLSTWKPPGAWSPPTLPHEWDSTEKV